MKYLAFLSMLFAVSGAVAAETSVQSLHVTVPWLTVPLDFHDADTLPLQMRFVHEPAAADASGARWVSSDPSVATVDGEGFVTLLKVGETTLTVRTGDVVSSNLHRSGDRLLIGWGECLLSVTPAENRSMANRNLRMVPTVATGVRRGGGPEKYLAWPENYGEAVVALWHDNKVGAFNIIFDDLPSSGDIPKWTALHEKYGLRSTFASDMVDYEGSPSGYFGSFGSQKYFDFINAGGEVISHSMRHPYPHQIAKFHTSDWAWELGGSRDSIQHSLDKHADKITRPYRSQSIGVAGGYHDYLRKFYTAARGGGGSYDTSSYSPVDYTRVGGWGSGIDAFYAILDRDYPNAPENYGGPILITTHGIHQHPIEFYCENFIYPNRDRIWCATYTDLTCYMQQRDAAELKVTEVSPDRIVFELTDYLCDELFDLPLTVKVKLDDSWDRLSATQGGHAPSIPTGSSEKTVNTGSAQIEARLVKHDGEIYALVKAIPDRGKVVLKKEGEVKKYGSNTALAALDYRIDLSEPDQPGNLPPRFSVPDFHPDTTEYHVKLPPGTDRVAFYATPADETSVARREPAMGIVKIMTNDQRLMTNEAGASSEGQLESAPVISHSSLVTSHCSVTITAEDETTRTYRIHFSVEEFEPIWGLSINTPPNLEQETMSQPVDFTVTARPEGRVDLSTIEWFVNDEKQIGASGTTFRYTPVKYGTYTVEARTDPRTEIDPPRGIILNRACGADGPTVTFISFEPIFNFFGLFKRTPRIEHYYAVGTEPQTIRFIKGAPRPTVTLFADDFERYEVGQPVPTSDDPEKQTFSDPASPESGIPTNWKFGEEGVRIARLPDRNNVAAWTTKDDRWIAAIAKQFPTSATDPLAVSFRIRADNDSRLTASDSFFQLHLNKTGMLWSLTGVDRWATRPWGFRGWWTPTQPKWLTVVYAFDPTNRNPTDGTGILETLHIGNEHYLGKVYDGDKTDVEFLPEPGRYGNAARAFVDGETRAFVFRFGAGPKDPANIGKYSTYLDDVRIYRIGSLVMTPAKETFVPNEPIIMNFSHHINWLTLQKERIAVIDSKGKPVPIESLGGDPLSFDYFTITFAPDTLKAGKTYTVTLDENVRDILDKAVYDSATFKVK